MTAVLKLATKPEHEQDVVEQAELMVEKAKAGLLLGFVAAGIRPDGGVDIFTVGPSIPIAVSIGAASILHHHLLKSVADK